MFNPHDDVPKVLEHAPLLRLAKKIRDHFAGGAVHEVELFLVNLVFNEEVADVYVPGSLSGGLPPILFHLHGTLVILMVLTSRDLVPLGLDEVHGPNGLWEEVSSTYELSFGGTLRVQFLAFGRGIQSPLSHGDVSAGVASHVVMRGKSGVDPGLHHAQIVDGQSEWEVNCPM